MSCKVNSCRFKNTHTTSGHMCGSCYKFGHGQLECRNIKLKEILKKDSAGDILPEANQCQLHFCNNKHNHITEAHMCFKCKEREAHQSSGCIIQDYDVLETTYSDDLVHRFDKDSFAQESNSYVIIQIGLGCSVYVKKYKDKLVGLFMHQDSWGQYPVTDKRPVMYRFIKNLDEKQFGDYDISQLQSDSYSCPLCKSDNLKSKGVEIKGSNDECKICMDESVEIYFPECKHACCCRSCFKKI
jgi:hypothetical protein